MSPYDFALIERRFNQLHSSNEIDFEKCNSEFATFQLFSELQKKVAFGRLWAGAPLRAAPGVCGLKWEE
eukprot:5985241-Prymnesium_polylepis.2